MNKQEFISQLSQKANLDESQASQVNEIIEGTSLLGNANKDKIIQNVVEKLGVDESQADEIYNVAMGILKDALVDKINPFHK